MGSPESLKLPCEVHHGAIGDVPWFLYKNDNQVRQLVSVVEGWREASRQQKKLDVVKAQDQALDQLSRNDKDFHE